MRLNRATIAAGMLGLGIILTEELAPRPQASSKPSDDDAPPMPDLNRPRRATVTTSNLPAQIEQDPETRQQRRQRERLKRKGRA